MCCEARTYSSFYRPVPDHPYATRAMNTRINSSSSKSVSASAATGASVQAWRREAALLLGVSEPVAQQFGETGLIEVEGKPVTLHPLLGQAAGPWVATARVARPPAVNEADWCDALLLANTRSLLLTHAAFGIAEDGDATLVMRIPPEHDHPHLHSTDLDGLVTMCNALRDGVSSRAGAATHAVAAPDTVRGTEPTETESPELDATDEVVELIRGAALQLGASPEQAVQAARTGSLDLLGLRAGVACDPDDEALVVAIDLGDDFLDSSKRCRIALAATLELILQAGAAVGRTAQRQCQLMARCALQGQSADSLAAWLHGLAVLAATMRAHHSQNLATPAAATSQH